MRIVIKHKEKRTLRVQDIEVGSKVYWPEKDIYITVNEINVKSSSNGLGFTADGYQGIIFLYSGLNTYFLHSKP